ncbi:MAG: hypothetical protein ACPG8W_08095 [Candidatus Promineifilaceae bacterium]
MISAEITVEQNPALVYIASLESKRSRRTMRGALNHIAQIMTKDDDAILLDWPWGNLRFQHTQVIRLTSLIVESSKTSKPYSPTAINQMLAALRGTLKAVWRLGLSADEYASAIDLKQVQNGTPPASRNIQRGELVALLDTCESDDAGVRDAAIISLMKINNNWVQHRVVR